MAEFKSVMDKYDAKGNRRLPTAEEEAITPVYPEEYLFGGAGKSVAMGLKTIAKKEPVRKFDVPKIGSNLVKPKEAKERIAREKEQKISDLFADKAEKSMINTNGDISFNNIRPDMGEQSKTNAAGDTYKKGGKVSGASKRADGIAQRGKTRGKMC
jgi:hypothetical protein